MTYQVVWALAARRLLAAIWTSAADKNAITRASNYIERLLMLDPLHEGKPRKKSYRVLFVTL